MSTQHTPAPWTVLSGDWDDAGNARYTLKGTTTVGYADARLIAAAPDLLQELINIASAKPSTWEDPSEFKAWAQSRAQAAIAKATGETQ